MHCVQMESRQPVYIKHLTLKRPNITGTNSASIPALLVAMATFKPILETADSFCAFQETSRKNILQERWEDHPFILLE